MIAEFNLRLAEESEQLQLDPETVRAGVVRLLTEPARGVYYLAEQDGQVVGQVMITYEWSDWRNGNLWWLQSVYVRPGCRNRGVFRALFHHLKELAAAQPDVCGLRLYMHHGNQTARRAYERLGMTPTAYEVLNLDLPSPPTPAP